MTTIADGPTGPTPVQRARDLVRDLRHANSPERVTDPVSQDSMTGLTQDRHQLTTSAGPQTVPAEMTDTVRLALPPELKEGQAHNDASSSAPTRRGPGQGNGKTTGKPGIGS